MTKHGDGVNEPTVLGILERYEEALTELRALEQDLADLATFRLKFITPHIKGPAGAPLKTPTRTVYEVSR